MSHRTLFVICATALAIASIVGCKMPDEAGWYFAEYDAVTWASWRFSENIDGGGETVQFIEDETVTIATASLDEAVALFKDISSYAETFNNAEARLLKSLGEDKWLVYEFIDNPWPVADSDRVCEITYQHDENGVAVFRFYATPDAYPNQGVARQEYYDVSYTITDLGGGRIELHERGEAIPPVDVPDWLLKSAFPDALFNSLLHIKEILE